MICGHGKIILCGWLRSPQIQRFMAEVCKSINFAVNAGERQITEEKQR